MAMAAGPGEAVKKGNAIRLDNMMVGDKKDWRAIESAKKLSLGGRSPASASWIGASCVSCRA